MKVSEIKEELEKEAKIIKDALNVNPKCNIYILKNIYIKWNY